MLHGAGIVLVIIVLVAVVAAASGRGESPVVSRLGNVLYWGASLVAALLALLAGAIAALNTQFEVTVDHAKRIFFRALRKLDASKPREI
jgi:hypothetical protein